MHVCDICKKKKSYHSRPLGVQNQTFLIQFYHLMMAVYMKKFLSPSFLMC